MPNVYQYIYIYIMYIYYDFIWASLIDRLSIPAVIGLKLGSVKTSKKSYFWKKVVFYAKKCFWVFFYFHFFWCFEMPLRRIKPTCVYPPSFSGIFSNIGVIKNTGETPLTYWERRKTALKKQVFWTCAVKTLCYTLYKCFRN